MSNIIEVTETHLSQVSENIERNEFTIENSRVGFYVVVSMSAMAGIWGTACLVFGLGNCSTLGVLGKGLVTAITGM